MAETLRARRRTDQEAVEETVRREKRYFHGTHRTLSPGETWRRIVGVLDQVGVTRVADVTALDSLGIPVFQAIRPASWNLSVSQGKALTPEAARVSGAMESIELWHAERLDHLPQVTLPLREMQYGNAVATADLKLRSDTWRLDALPIPWVEAASLTGTRSAWLPRGMLELDFRVPPRLRPNAFHLTSNGLASGNCLEEALLHGLCELIERHGLYRAFRQPETRVPIDVESIEADDLVDLLARMRGAGMKLAVYDLTFDIGVPVILVDLVARDLPQIWRGAGCHPSPEIALSRALTEAAQARLTYISGARDDILSFPRDMDAEERYRAFVPPEPARRLDELADLSTAGVDADLSKVLERLDASGHGAFYVDLSRETIGIPVVTAFVPGLREAPHV